jgi:hypothetical protein
MADDPIPGKVMLYGSGRTIEGECYHEGTFTDYSGNQYPILINIVKQPKKVKP